MKPQARHARWLLLGLLAIGLLLPMPGWTGPQATTQPPSGDVTLPADWVKTLTWRSIGPANMGGRITAVSVFEADPSTYYVATASGGLLKTINNGITFDHQFDREATVSIGDVCVAPSNRDIVWVGTGENNPRNSVSYGDGVHKSVDGGKTWQNMGLKKTFQIGKILIHPTNPNIVYVGALGRLYGGNPQRGLFKTSNGGKTWQKVFYIDENTGVIDMAIHPSDPNTLLVAMWERQRDGFDSHLGKDIPQGYDVYDPIKKWGPKTGIYRTTDGGKSFKKMTSGLPTCELGRIGLDYYRKDPNIVYAVVDCEKIGMGTPPARIAGNGTIAVIGEDAEGGARLTMVLPDGTGEKAGLREGDVIRLVADRIVETYQDLFEEIRDTAVGKKVTLRVLRGGKTLEVVVTVAERKGSAGGGFGGPGGAKKDRPYHAFYGGQAPNIQDQQGPNSHEYGGIYKSTNGGESWTRVNSLNPRPMYFSVIRVDPSDDKNICVLGVQQYISSDGGRLFRSTFGRGVHADGHALWINPKNGRHMVIGTDGGTYVTYDRGRNWDHLNHLALGQFYHVAVCNKKPYCIYGGLQDNGTWGGPSVGLRGGIGPINEDWISVGSGDGFVCRVDPQDPDLVYYESQNGVMRRRHLRTGEQSFIRPARGKDDPPHRFNWNTPFILSQHNPKIYYCAGEFVFRSLNQGDDLKIISPEITTTKRGSATALAESPKNPDVLWVGTDDGALWVTRNGGREWQNVTANVGLGGLRWVATIEPSRFVEGRAYVVFDAHRSDDDRPYVYVTEDFGKSWRSIGNTLPMGSTRCLREDVKNANLLYLGTEFAVFASINRGNSWTRINNNLPTVAVHEIAVHPTAGEIVAGTHGRSLWILDVSALRQMTAAAVQAKVSLYHPQDAVQWRQLPAMGRTNRRFIGQNPPPGAHVYYSLTEKAEKVSLKVIDIQGKVLKELEGDGSPGLHKLTWDMSQPAKGGKDGLGGGGMGGFSGIPQRVLVPPADFRIVLNVDGRDYNESLRVLAHAP